MLHRISQSQRFGALLLGVALLLGSVVFTGCTDGVFSVEDPLEARRSFNDGPKFRQAHLMERAIHANAGKSMSGSGLGLIVAVQDGVQKQRILDRYKILNRYRVVDRYEYDFVFNGYAWTITDTGGGEDYQVFIDSLLADPDILWFEPDFNIGSIPSDGLDGVSSQQVPWSVAAIGGIESWTTSGNNEGSVGVDVYVLDTGVSNPDINVYESVDFRDGLNDPSDHDGHGTHVAGIAAAIDDYDGLVGVAPGARLHNYKVLGDDGRSDVSVVIAAVEHIMAAKQASPSTPMVVNLSLGEDIGTPDYTALDEAIRTASEAGVVFVVAAGNQGKNASGITPAHVADAITVGSYDVSGRFSAFSNYGSMVDILAPGEGVMSLAPSTGGPGTPVEMDGTSMAAAHVTGAAALYLALNPAASPAEVRAALLGSAKADVFGVPSATTNNRVWVGGDAETVRDEFIYYSYTNNNGTQPWLDAWQEYNDDGVINDGEVYVVNNDGSRRLHIGEFGTDGIWTSPRGAWRMADLSGAARARLTFIYRRVSWEGTDHLAIEASTDGGATWTEAGRIDTEYYDQAWQAASFDMTPFISAQTALRFTGRFEDNDYFDYILLDDIQIAFGDLPVPPGTPPPPPSPPPPPPPPPATLETFETRVAGDNDDAEERLSNGDMYRSSSDLELVRDGSRDQLVGMRFRNVSIPQGAVIANAYIQFTVDETDSGTANLTFHGHDTDDAPYFSSSDDDISDRPTTSASVAWSPPAWTSVGAAGADQRTPNLASIIQEIVDRGGWDSGNDLVLIVSGTGERTAESRDGSSSKAPLLHIEYQP